MSIRTKLDVAVGATVERRPPRAWAEGERPERLWRLLRNLQRNRDRVIVEKVNLVQRHVKPRGDQPGGTVEKEAPLHISNVALWNQQEGRAMRVGWKVLEDGRKVRFDKKSGAVID